MNIVRLGIVYKIDGIITGNQAWERMLGGWRGGGGERGPAGQKARSWMGWGELIEKYNERVNRMISKRILR